MSLDDTIATQARSELPLTWDQLAKVPEQGDPVLGPQVVERRVDSVMYELFGQKITEAVQAVLDPLVVEYAGKKVALKLIGPGRDFWSKQVQSFTATGRNEMKSYANRAEELSKLREQLLVEIKQMWPDVEPLLPSARQRVGAPVPVVELLGSDGHVTPDPDEFEPPFAPPR